LGELDELATVIAELRGTPLDAAPSSAAGGGQSRTLAASSQAVAASKKNAEPEAPSLAQGFASAVSSVLAAGPQRISSPPAQAKVDTPVAPKPQVVSPAASSVVVHRANGDSKAGSEIAVNDLLAESAE